VQIANGIEMLELSIEIMGEKNVIYPAVVWDNNTVILIDAGYPGQLSQIQEAIKQAGLSFLKINKIIITHHDMDHIGNMNDILKTLPKHPEIIAHKKEKKYIQSEKCPTKITQLKPRINSMSTEMKVMYENLKTGYENHKILVDRTVKSGEELPYCGGIEIIYTPGHTPGHISLYIRQNKTLIAGDALFVKEGILTPPPKFVNFNNSLALKSINKFSQYDINTVICYHGGIYNKNVNQRIVELVTI
jgi:glyoxylase-like metal-dependent hydrolase (beta-lactamase superfamily II)